MKSREFAAIALGAALVFPGHVTGALANDCVERRIQYVDPGADGKVGSTDDTNLNNVRLLYTPDKVLTVTDYGVFDQSPAGWLGMEAQGLAAVIGHRGSEGDLLEASFTLQYDDDGLQIGYALHPAGGAAESIVDAPESVVTLFRYVYDNEDFLVRALEFGRPGTDALWGTSDDVLAGYEEYVYDEADFLVTAVRKDAAGIVLETRAFLHDAAGRLLSMTRRTGSQRIQDVYEFSYDDRHRVAQRVDRYHNGFSGRHVPLNDTRLVYMYDEDHAEVPVQITRYRAGGDGIIGTADDVPDLYSTMRPVCLQPPEG